MLPSETMIWQPEFTDKTLSRKPGAVQNVKDPAENARNKLAVQTSVNQIITQLEQTAKAFSQSNIDCLR
ncbi:hypothetical protein V9747_24760, partial [Escherichia coli]|uniref:hypothetical protein n=1 Tax=Escherichia coli TaxID=562 RepID=UPI00311B0C21